MKMTLDEFVVAFADMFEETPKEEFSASTEYKELDEWSSLLSLSLIAFVKKNFEIKLTGKEMRSCETIEDLYKLIQTKK